MNNFIIEHSTETKILSLVPLDHWNIFQTYWADLKSPDLALLVPGTDCGTAVSHKSDTNPTSKHLA
jgi:hypothetical protein